MRRTLTNLSLSALSLLACVVAAEIILRSLPVQAFRLVDPAFFAEENWFEFDPELHYTLLRNHRRTITYRDDECGQATIEIETSSAGIRDRVPRGVVDRLAVFVGDSFTEGYHVDAADTYPVQIRGLLRNRVETLNYGIHNYDVADYYRAAQRVKRDFNPDYVFVGLFIGNDVFRYSRSSYKSEGLLSVIRSYSYTYSWLLMGLRRVVTSPPLSQTPDQVRASVDLDDFYDDYTGSACSETELWEYIQSYVVSRTSERSYLLYGNPWSMFLAAKSTAMILGDLREILGGTELHVLIIPERIQVSDSEWEWLTREFPRTYKHRALVIDKLARALREQGVPYTDLRPHLSRESYLRFDGHLSARGHKEVAQAVSVLLGDP